MLAAGPQPLCRIPQAPLAGGTFPSLGRMAAAAFLGQVDPHKVANEVRTQIAAFMSFQIRVVAGLRVLAGRS